MFNAILFAIVTVIISFVLAAGIMVWVMESGAN